MRSFLLIFVLVLVAACSVGGRQSVRPLDPPYMPTPPPNAPQEYRQGWLDGCETGMAAHGYDVYRTNYKFKQDPSQILNPTYYKAWKDSENYCRTYIFEYSFRSLVPWCSLDGITDDCSDNTWYNGGVPFFDRSTEAVGYDWIGSGGIDSLLGGGQKGIGGDRGGGLLGMNEDGISDVLGWGPLPGVGGTF